MLVEIKKNIEKVSEMSLYSAMDSNRFQVPSSFKYWIEKPERFLRFEKGKGTVILSHS